MGRARATRIRNLDEATAKFPATPIADEALGAAMLYSSGTTGKPKGVSAAAAGSAARRNRCRSFSLLTSTGGFAKDRSISRRRRSTIRRPWPASSARSAAAGRSSSWSISTPEQFLR